MNIALILLILVPILIVWVFIQMCKRNFWPMGLLIVLPLLLLTLAHQGDLRKAEIAEMEAQKEADTVQAIAEQRREAKLASLENDSSSAHGTIEIVRPERPTAELWEELTKSRIDLDGESGEAVKASHDSEEAEEAEDVQDVPVPDWVKTKPKPIGNVYKVVVSSDPFSTEDECFDQLEDMFDEQIRVRLKKILPADQRAKVHRASLSEIGIPISYVMREICRESYTEIQNLSFGAMKSVHVLMEFDASVEQELRSRWINYQRRQGLGFVSKMAALVLSALAICYSLLQIDTWTRGYYSKRLLVGLPVAIIAVALLVFS